MDSSSAPWYDASIDSSGLARTGEALAEIVIRHLDHFARPRFESIHAFGLDADLFTVREAVRIAAQQLSYHIVVLEGAEIENKQQALSNLSRSYRFPYTEIESANWDGAADWISDLSWIACDSNTDEDIQGFILLYLFPNRFFKRFADFSTFLELLAEGTQAQLERDRPFHVILGPVDYQMLPKLEKSPIGHRLCPSCRERDRLSSMSGHRLLGWNAQNQHTTGEST